MTDNIINKPSKRSDEDFFVDVAEKIEKNFYVFKKHARQRLKDRNISDLEVLDILEGKIGRKRRRNKSKDKYEEGKQDWNYCVEGINLDGYTIRITVSFENGIIPIITVMWMN